MGEEPGLADASGCDWVGDAGGDEPGDVGVAEGVGGDAFEVGGFGDASGPDSPQ